MNVQVDLDVKLPIHIDHFAALQAVAGKAGLLYKWKKDGILDMRDWRDLRRKLIALKRIERRVYPRLAAQDGAS